MENIKKKGNICKLGTTLGGYYYSVLVTQFLQPPDFCWKSSDTVLQAADSYCGLLKYWNLSILPVTSYAFKLCM